MMSRRRNRQRRWAREDELTYLQLFQRLNPRDQHKINEAVIWAVNCLTDLDGIGLPGTKALIGTRAKQLILDWDRETWGLASKRFRNAITKRQAKVKIDTLKAA